MCHLIISLKKMNTLKIIISSLVLFIQLTFAYDSYETNNFEVRMPNVHPANDDQYMKFTKKLDLDKQLWYIVEFQPLADMSIVHHMIVRGCQLAIPGQLPCLINTVTLYAWARNAPNLTLPDGVGFKIGGDSQIQYINIEVHYGSIANIDSINGDNSGVNLVLTNEKKPKMAGVITTYTMGCIKNNETTCFDTACQYTSPITIYPFAYRTHTHARGVEVSGYNIVTNDGNYDWQLIGKKNPQLPQYFYQVENKDLSIKQGNLLAFRCVMKNNENREICVGGTHNDEMCNFYIMYYVNDNTLPSFGCGSLGPPRYAWETDDQLTDKNIPEPYCLKLSGTKKN